MAKCTHPECTGVHNYNRYHELCPRSLDRKRDKDDRYYASSKGTLARLRKTKWAAYGSAAYAEMEEWINSGSADELASAAVASDDPIWFIIRTTFEEVFGDLYRPDLFSWL
jgi:hypothetical protein